MGYGPQADWAGLARGIRGWYRSLHPDRHTDRGLLPALGNAAWPPAIPMGMRFERVWPMATCHEGSGTVKYT